MMGMILPEKKTYGGLFFHQINLTFKMI